MVNIDAVGLIWTGS